MEKKDVNIMRQVRYKLLASPNIHRTKRRISMEYQPQKQVQKIWSELVRIQDKAQEYKHIKLEMCDQNPFPEICKHGDISFPSLRIVFDHRYKLEKPMREIKERQRIEKLKYGDRIAMRVRKWKKETKRYLYYDRYHLNNMLI